jgi:thiamine-phosphate pyrophosphorylase
MHHFLLKKYCFIDSFDLNLLKCQDKNTIIIYRNYKKKNILDDLIKIKQICKKENYKFYLANNIKLAIKLKLDGAYLPSFYKHFHHLSYSYRKDFILIGSAHNNKELKIKEKQKVKFIFLSSLFNKNKNYLGIIKFKILSKNFNNNIIALGGINKNNINQLKLLKVFGIAGISMFKKKGP